MIQKIPDASNGPSKLEMNPQLEGMFAKLGLSGSFVLWMPGHSTRGVEVMRQKGGVRFRACCLATSADYALAAQLAAAAARATKTLVMAEHGPDGHTIEPLEPDTFSKMFDETFFEKNAQEMSRGLLAEIASGAPHYFTVGTDWVCLEGRHLAGATGAQRLEVARKALLTGKAPTGTPVDVGRDEAVLLTKAMLIAVAADGKIDAAESELLQALLLTVPGLSGQDPKLLLADAQKAEVTLASLAELSLPARKKAFVLAAELLACTRGGKIAGETTDPNVKAAIALSTALRLASEESFMIDVGSTVAAKYIPDPVSREMARTFVEAMLLAAAADGRVSDEEQAVIAALARTVPQLAVDDFGALLKEAQARVALGKDVLAADFRALPKFKNKCWALACEVAHCMGERQAHKPMLAQLRDWIVPAPDFANMPIVAFAAKYTSRDANSPARPFSAKNEQSVAVPRSPLQAIADKAVAEGAKFVLADTNHFAVLVTERSGAVETRVATQGFLPESVNELKSWLSQNQAGVDRYAIAFPGLSFSKGGAVVVAEAGDRSTPEGLRLEQRYDVKTSQGPSALVGEPSAGHPSECCSSSRPAKRRCAS